MAERRYLDFELAIEEIDGERFRARVLDSPAGQARGTFTFPLSPLELENFTLRVGRGARSGSRRLESSEREAARVLGSKLFDAVFTDEVEICLRRSIDEAERSGHGLRIRLRLSDAPALSTVPWEYLYSTSHDRFLVLSSWTPLVRYLDLPRRVLPLRVEPPVRVLVMISSPSDYPALDTNAEWTRLNDGLADLIAAGKVELHRLDDASLTALQAALLRNEYHALHFIGHGGFDEPSGDGVLMLEGEGGRARIVPGRDLGTILHDHRSLRLAVLNACEGARTSVSDPFSGSAQSLVRAGIPAVVAMQFEISDRAAVSFAHTFYGAVAIGLPIDASVTEARKAVFGQGDDAEWGTPVVYMRSPDGHIFDIPDAASAPVEPVPPDAAIAPNDAPVERPAAPVVVGVTETDIATPVDPPAADTAPATVDVPAAEPAEPVVVDSGPATDDAEPAGELIAAADPPADAADTPSNLDESTSPELPADTSTADPPPADPRSQPEPRTREAERPPPPPIRHEPPGTVIGTGSPGPRGPDDARARDRPVRPPPPAPEAYEPEPRWSAEPEPRLWTDRPATRVAAAGVGLAVLVGFVAALFAVLDNDADTVAGENGGNGTSTVEIVREEPDSSTVLGPVVTARPLSGFEADGVLDEWAAFDTHVETPHQVFTSSQANWDGSDDVDSKWWLGYDNENLYLAVSVTDDIHNQPSTGNQIYRGDAVDIHVGIETGAELPDDDDYQVILSPGDFAGSPPTHVVFQGDGNHFARDRQSANIVVAARQTDAGYRLEASIPWTEFGLSGPPPALGEGVPVLLLLSVFDNDGEFEATTGRVAQTVVKSHVDGGFQRPLQWGNLVVAE